MSRIKSLLAAVCLILILGTTATFAVELQSQASPEDMLKNAEALKEAGDYNAAYDIVKKLKDENSGNSKYEIAYLDVVLEQVRSLKEAGDPGWKAKTKEIGAKIKSLYKANLSNAEYWLVYAKYSWLVEAKRDKHIYKALEKAFYYRPGYLDAYILKGDINFDLARNAPIESIQDATSLTGGRADSSTKSFLSKTAKASYESALSSPDISVKKKAYVYFKLGELEDKLSGNKDDARSYWEKAASLSPDSKAGQLANARLGK